MYREPINFEELEYLSSFMNISFDLSHQSAHS